MWFTAMPMNNKELLLEKIQNILEADLNFLSKFSPEELRVLAIALEELIARQEKSVCIDPDLLR